MIQPWVFVPRDQVGGVHDGVRIAPGLDDHSDAPLKHWRDHLKRKRQREEERNRQKKPPDMPAVQEDDKPAGSIDEYA